MGFKLFGGTPVVRTQSKKMWNETPIRFSCQHAVNYKFSCSVELHRSTIRGVNNIGDAGGQINSASYGSGHVVDNGDVAVGQVQSGLGGRYSG